MARKAPTKTSEPSSQGETLTTLGVIRLGDGWRVVTLVTQGDQVLSRTLTEPNMRSITLDEFKRQAALKFWREL